MPTGIPSGGGGSVAAADITDATATGQALLTAASAAAALAAIGGSAGISTGTYAVRPSSPSVGDFYLVTSGVRKGSLYRCLVAGYWFIAAIVLPPELQSGLVLYVDGEDLIGPGINKWINRAPMQAGNDLILLSSVGTVTVAASSLSAGINYAQTNGNARLETAIPYPSSSGGRTMAVLTSNITPNTGAAFNHIMSEGANVLNQMYSICCRSNSLSQWGNHYWSTTYTTGTSGTETTPVRIVARYNGTQDTFFRNNSALGSANTITLSAPTTYAGITLFAIANGGGEPAPSGTRIHAAASWNTSLTNTQVGILDAWLLERHGS